MTDDEFEEEFKRETAQIWEPRLREIGDCADRLWAIGTEISSDMMDLAYRLKSSASELHGIRRQIQERLKEKE